MQMYTRPAGLHTPQTSARARRLRAAASEAGARRSHRRLHGAFGAWLSVLRAAVARYLDEEAPAVSCGSEESWATRYASGGGSAERQSNAPPMLARALEAIRRDIAAADAAAEDGGGGGGGDMYGTEWQARVGDQAR